MAKSAQIYRANPPCRTRDTRVSATKRGYDYQWQEFRKRYLILNPYCLDCQARGQRTFAKHVHHVVKVSARCDLKYENENLMPLCEACHQVRTNAGQ